MTLPIAWPELDLGCIETLGEEELDEVRAIPGAMLPIQSLRVGGITISHELKSAALAGGDYLDHFSLSRQDWHVRRRRFRQGPAGGHGCGAGGRNTQGHAQNRTASDPGNGSLKQETAAPRDTLQIYRYPALLDPITAQLHLSRAGMPEPTLLWAGACPVLKVAGIPPGPFREINYDHLTLQVEPRRFLTVLHRWFDRRAQYPTSRTRGRGTAARLRKPCRKIHAGIAGPHLLNHTEIYGRLPAI
jgi:hypothetical protein